MVRTRHTKPLVLQNTLPTGTAVSIGHFSRERPAPRHSRHEVAVGGQTPPLPVFDSERSQQGGRTFEINLVVG